MNDADLNLQTKRVKSLVRRWVEVLGLGEWNVIVQVVRSPIADVDGAFCAPMKCSVAWPYLLVHVDISAEVIADFDDEDLEGQFLHECAHVFLAEMRGAREDEIDHEERVATMLARAFGNIKRAYGSKEKRKRD